MTRRSGLEYHKNNLIDISNIMNSMKTLAYLETRKLMRFIEAQEKVFENIDAVAKDFISFHPDLLSNDNNKNPVYLVIGSERGLCGDFNSNIVRYVEDILKTKNKEGLAAIFVGQKLYPLFKRFDGKSVFVEGASIVEEIHATLDQLVSELAKLQKANGIPILYVVSHTISEGLVTRQLLPPFKQHLNTKREYFNPPVLHLQYRDFFIELVDQYVLASLNEILYASLMTENQQRLTHLDNAVKKLDEKIVALGININRLRQEEIIEEIEVILLNSSQPDL